MDIARPEFKLQKRRRQIAVSAVGVVIISALTIGVYRLRPAAPTVERGTVWTDSVKRGSMLRQVRGVGSLVPSQEAVLQIPAETEATVVRIRMLPGSLVKSDTLLLEMSNPQVEQASVDAQLQLKAAEAEYQSQRMTLESALMNQKAGAATVQADYTQAQLQAQTDKALYDLGVISGNVMRVDPAVQNGTVTVDVKLTGELPKGARPDLSVDGTVDLERLDNVLYVGRPAFGQENSTISLFRLGPDGHEALRVPVKVGRASVNSIQVVDGLHEGDTVVLSDMSRWDNTDRIRLQD
jgi:multidrug efflux pump subunit AcrA (membrane-fusion protein)